MRTKAPEGTTIKDYSGLKDQWLHLVPSQIDIQEAEYILEAQRKYLDADYIPSPISWFHPSFLCKVHQAMLEPMWEWAGKIRVSEKNIGIKAYLIRQQLAQLCEEVIYWNSSAVDLTFLEQTARIHHGLVSIHLFEDGNGRHTRLISDRYLKSFHRPYPNWPTDLQKDGTPRIQYIQTLQAADKGDYEPLIELMQKLGASDPRITELHESTFYRQKLKKEQLEHMTKALLRRGIS